MTDQLEEELHGLWCCARCGRSPDCLTVAEL